MYSQSQKIGITFIRYSQNQKIGITFIRYSQSQKIGKPTKILGAINPEVKKDISYQIVSMMHCNVIKEIKGHKC
jgi:hypothetical protein